MAFESSLSLDEKVKDAVAKSKVLVVGAGGIGCEVLKNLAFSGFTNIEVIDLDTIDISNLNRQFLFRREHIGQPKAIVARDSVLAFNPDIKVVAYHDSIISNKYGVNYFKTFNLVINALDNRTARNHVNRMCLAADVPLIETGTAGYSGQVEFIKKGMTQCYECQPKAAQKTYPGCTIRNTPSEPVHCIVWAKHLFNQLFGEDDPDQDVSPDTADPEAAGTAGENALETKIDNKGNINRISTRMWVQSVEYNPEKLFKKFFEDDINYLLSMKNLWLTRVAPVPLIWSDIIVPEKPSEYVGMKDMEVWDLFKSKTVFENSIKILKEKFDKLPEGDYLSWDKDDRPSMEFVAACANIRSHIFGISKKSLFDAKSIAGNIIPAIATTNAIISGLAVLQAFKIISEEYEKCQSIYLRQHPNHRNLIMVPERSLSKPNPNCYVCSSKPEVHVFLNVDKMILKEFESEILKKELNMIAPDAMRDGDLILSSEEGETESNMSKILREIGVVDGTILKVDDFLQSYELTIIVNHVTEVQNDCPYKIVADLSQLRSQTNGKLEPNQENQTNEKKNQENNDHVHIEIENDDAEPSSSKKLKAEDSDDDLMLIE